MLFNFELVSFHERLTTQMADRIRSVARGALPQDVVVNLTELQQAQDECNRILEAALRAPKRPTNWNLVRAVISEITGK